MLDYCELAIDSMERETAFYAAAFGWDLTPYGKDYAAFEQGPCQIGFNAKAEPGQSAILPIIRFAVLEAARDAVRQAGGVIVRDIFAYPGGRRFHFRDPAGLVLAAYTPE